MTVADSTTINHQSAVRCEDVGKTFGGTHAVSQLSLEIAPGTVHALVGENGAGKSTLLGMMSGRVIATAGYVEIFGSRLHRGDAREARELGLSAVYQEMTMVPGLSAEANVFMGQLKSTRGFLARKTMRREFEEYCREFEVQIDPEALARDLSVSQQQMLEIIRSVHAGARIILMDEPSAALAEHEREVLYRVLSRLRESGTTIVFVSHNLDEVFALSDTISVLRDGHLVRTASVQEWTKPTLIEAMVCRNVDVGKRLRSVSSRTDGDSYALHAVGVSVPGVLHDLEIAIRPGEIVGLWGLVGSGRTTFLRALAGLEVKSEGKLTVLDREVPWPRSTRDSIDRGVVLVPEDRKLALVMSMDAASNVWIGRRPYRGPKIRRAIEQTRALEYLSDFGFLRQKLRAQVGQLSGGNQQKVLLGKWAARSPAVFLVDEPTRGIDVGAKAEVLKSLVEFANRGAAVVVTSSELEEVLAIADRLLVFAGGAIVDQVDSGDPRFANEQIVEMGFRQKERTNGSVNSGD